MSDVINKRNSENGVTVFGVVGIVFIILKIVKVIDWKWIWVLSPFWIPLAIVLIASIIYLLIAVAIGTGYTISEKIASIRNNSYKRSKDTKISNINIKEDDFKKMDKERASAITVDYKVVDED